MRRWRNGWPPSSRTGGPPDESAPRRLAAQPSRADDGRAEAWPPRSHHQPEAEQALDDDDQAAHDDDLQRRGRGDRRVRLELDLREDVDGQARRIRAAEERAEV